MKIKNPEKRLKQFWGKVDQKHIKSFFPFIKGPKILDVGCGNGSTTHYIVTNSSWRGRFSKENMRMINHELLSQFAARALPSMKA